MLIKKCLVVFTIILMLSLSIPQIVAGESTNNSQTTQLLKKT